MAFKRKVVLEKIRVYWDSRDEITVYDGILYKSHQVIVPTSLRPEMLRKIHKAHQGADDSIRQARNQCTGQLCKQQSGRYVHLAEFVPST